MRWGLWPVHQTATRGWSRWFGFTFGGVVMTSIFIYNLSYLCWLCLQITTLAAAPDICLNELQLFLSSFTSVYDADAELKFMVLWFFTVSDLSIDFYLKNDVLDINLTSSTNINFPLLAEWEEDVWYVLQSRNLRFKIWRLGRAGVCVQGTGHHEAGRDLSQARGKYLEMTS